MIATVYVKCNAAHPELPLSPMVAFQDSPSSIRVIDVPRRIGTWDITSVQVKAKYPDGTVTAKECERVGNVWVATLGPSAAVGTCANGFVIGASGIDEHGDPVDGYILGVGDVEILPADSSVHPGLTGHAVTIYDTRPDTPHRGDAVWTDGRLTVWDGSAWRDTFDGIRHGYNKMSEGGVDKPVVFGEADGQRIVLTRRDITLVGDPSTGATTTVGADGINISAPMAGLQVGDITLVSSPDDGFNLIQLGDERVLTDADVEPDTTVKGAATKAVRDGKGNIIQNTYAKFGDLRVVMDLVDVAGGHEVRLNGVKQTYAQVKTYAESRNAVIRHGQGTYRVTYVGQSEMMWDCTGTVQGAVKTGQIHMFAEGNVVQLVAARELAIKTDIHDAKITITQGGVEKGSITLNQSTPKTIELDAGGGGGGDVKCLLLVEHHGSSSQYVQWSAKDSAGTTHTYMVRRDGATIELLIDGIKAAGTNQNGNTMLVTVDGILSLSDNGYGGDSMCVVDNAPGPTSGTINTAGHHSVSVIFGECLEQTTPISMADGTTKPVCELHVGDMVLSVNPETMQLEADEVSDCDAGCLKQHNKSDVWTFADGTTVTTVKPHQFYNVRTGRMEYIADFRIGDEVRKVDGTTTALTGHETRYGVTYHNTLYTKRYNNYFAGGVLTGNRHSVKWGWLWRRDHGGEA